MGHKILLDGNKIFPGRNSEIIQQTFNNKIWNVESLGKVFEKI